MQFSSIWQILLTAVKSRFLLLCLSVLTAAPLGAIEPIIVVTSDFVSNPIQPQVSVDEAGVIYIAFGAGESIYVCKSTDLGISYSNPAQVATVPKLALGMRRGPRISASKSSVVISAISHESGNLFAWNSNDGGESWSKPSVVNNIPNVAREGLHGMAMGKSGIVFCTWLDLRNKGTQIFGSSSKDGGRTWRENSLIYASPSGTVCECCHPSVAMDSDGAIYVMWRNMLDGHRDMFVATSEDGGQTFSEGRRLGLGKWKLDACPMDGGFLALASPGQLSTVWRREKQIFQSNASRHGSPLNEQRLGAGEQPWATATPEGVTTVWISRRGGELWLSSSPEREPTKLADHANDPVIAASTITKGPVVTVWETGTKPNTSIVAMVVGP